MLKLISSFVDSVLPEREARPYGAFRDVLVVDASASMHDKAFVANESKLETMHKAVRQFAQQKLEARPQDYLGLVAYHHNSKVCCPLLNIGSDYDQIVQAIDSVLTLESGMTQLHTGLKDASKLFSRVRFSFNDQQRVIAYSDGYDNSTAKALRIANKIKRGGVLIECFGLGKSPVEVDEAFLKKIASTGPDGGVHYRFLGDLDIIQETFNEIALGTLIVEFGDDEG